MIKKIIYVSFVLLLMCIIWFLIKQRVTIIIEKTIPNDIEIKKNYNKVTSQ